MAVLSDSQDDSQHGGRLGILAVGSGILTPNFELRRTSMDGGIHRSCGLQNRWRLPDISSPFVHSY